MEQEHPRVRFAGAGPDGMGARVGQPWPNDVTVLEEGHDSFVADLPFMGKELGGAAEKIERMPEREVQAMPSAAVRELCLTQVHRPYRSFPS